MTFMTYSSTITPRLTRGHMPSCLLIIILPCRIVRLIWTMLMPYGKRLGILVRTWQLCHHYPLPKKFRGLDCIDGDKDDLRFLDPQGVCVWLSAKGKAKKDTSGFVVHNLYSYLHKNIN